MPFRFLRRQDPKLTIPVLLVSLFVGSGVLTSSSRLQSARPTPPHSLPATAFWTGQTVDSRLWDDPFQVVSKSQGPNSSNPDAPKRSVADLDKETVLAGTITAAALLGLLVDHMASLAEQPGAEPLAWFDGVSVWPSVLFRFLAGMLAMAYVVRLSWLWQRNLRSLASRFGLPQPGLLGPVNLDIPGWERGLREWKDWLSSWPLGLFTFGWSCPLTPTGRVDGQRLWSEYCWRASIPGRVTRAALLTVVFVMTDMALFRGFHHPPAPIRGPDAAAWHQWSVILAPAAVTFLVVYVWDATRLCDVMTQHLAQATTNYPASARSAARRKVGLKGVTAAAWLDVSIIAARTTVIGRSLYYPLVAILVLIIARNDRFDNWVWSLPVVAVMLMSLGATLFSFWVLDRSASWARTQELARLHSVRNRVSHWSDRPSKKDPERSLRILDYVIKWIHENQDGAFSPIRSKPFWSAVIPAGGAVLVTALTWLVSYL